MFSLQKETSFLYCTKLPCRSEENATRIFIGSSIGIFNEGTCFFVTQLKARLFLPLQIQHIQTMKTMRSQRVQILVLLLLFSLILLTIGKKEHVTTGTGSVFDGPVVGIDLGTTYSCVGIYRDGNVEIIPNEQGNRITPSVVSWGSNGETLVGEAAKNNAPFNPKNTLYDVKRLIGRKYKEVLKKDRNLFSYDLTEKDGRVYIKVDINGEKKILAPEEVSAMVLTKMKQIAEKYLNEKVKHAVITVPAYFNDQQRQATKDAGKIAGLNVVRIINEPTAAAMAYGLYKKKEETVLVFDLGGGTFDVSLLTIDNGVFEVIATSGDTHLGGEDFDLRLLEYLIGQLKKQIPDMDEDKFRKDMKSFQRLKAAAENAKRTLSYETETRVEIEGLYEGRDFSERVTRAQFEKVNMDLFQKTLEPVKRVLQDSNLEKSDVDEIILVGGSTRIPKIRELLQKFFNGKKLNDKINPDEAVAYGAAVQAAVLARTIEDKDIVLIDVTPLSLGIETAGGVMATIIPRNTPIPTQKFDIFTTSSDYQERLSIPIYEGERRMTKFNRLLGELQLTGIPPAPKGVPKIKVTFELDQNGILRVVAEDQATHNKQEIEIQKGTLSADEIEKMTADAEKNAKKDAEFMEKEELKRKITAYIENVKAQLANKEISKKLADSDKNTIADKVKKTLNWLNSKGNSLEKKDLQKGFQSMRNVINPIISKLYGSDGLSDDLLFGDNDNFDDDSSIDDNNPTSSVDDEPIDDNKGHDEL